MPLQRFFVENGAYHTTSSTHGRRPLLSDVRVATLVIEAIDSARARGLVFVLAYVLMPDHMHLLAVPGEGHTISSVMKTIKGGSAKAANKTGVIDGPLWQQGFYDRVIRGETHLITTVEYIHRNPVVAGLVKNPSEYRFSSAHPGRATDVERFFLG